VQVAKARGAYVIALASAANADFVRSLGADEVIDYAATDFTDVVGDLDVVLEVIGGDYPAKALDVLKYGGILVSIQPTTVASVARDAADRGIRVAGLFVEADRLAMSALADLAAAGELVPTIAATFPLGQAATAQSAKAGPGKVVLTVS
jgi:NADPH:quinone reductase-like Zn-dependent oxidoreductase